MCRLLLYNPQNNSLLPEPQKCRPSLPACLPGAVPPVPAGSYLQPWRHQLVVMTTTHPSPGSCRPTLCSGCHFVPVRRWKVVHRTAGWGRLFTRKKTLTRIDRSLYFLSPPPPPPPPPLLPTPVWVFSASLSLSLFLSHISVEFATSESFVSFKERWWGNHSCFCSFFSPCLLSNVVEASHQTGTRRFPAAELTEAAPKYNRCYNRYGIWSQLFVPIDLST